MKTAICYYSEHHGNTKLLISAIQDYGSFAKPLLSFAQINLLDKKEVFFLFTCGSMSDSYTKRIREIAEAKEARILGEYGCFGFDTFGPFKIVGGIKKGHPTDEEICGAVEFFMKIS